MNTLLVGALIIGVCCLMTLRYARVRHRLRRAEGAIRPRDEVLAAAAHDLRNPLSVILAMTQLVAKRARHPDRLDAGCWSADVGRPATAARRLAVQVDRLLDIPSTAARRTPGLRRVPADLVVLVREVMAEWQGTSSRHHLRLDTPTEHLVGWFDPVRLERVVDNLVGNAVKYSPRAAA